MQKTLGALVAIILAGGSALAHDDHCHVKDAAGKVSDDKSAKTKAGCEKKGGSWVDHHLHCHKAGADGKMADFPDGKDQKSCKAKGGQWTDHAHEGLE